MDNTYTLLGWGRDYHPGNWFYNPAYVVNRVYYITKGTVYYKDNTILKPGHFYLFGADPSFRVRQSEEDPVDHIFFDFLTYRPLISDEYLEIDPSRNRKLLFLAQAMEEEFTEYVPGRSSMTMPEQSWVELGKHYLELILHALDTELSGEVDYSEVTLSMLRIMHGGDMKDLSVNRIAEEMNMDVDYLIRRFRREVGVTPHKYLARMKKEQAISYARQGLGCTEIAERLGFGSLAAFSYFFKREAGVNLSEVGKR